MDNVTKAQIHEAMRTRVANGLSYQQIETEFINAGYTKQQIQAFYNEATDSQVQSTPDISNNNLPDRPSHLTAILVTSFLSVCAIVVVFAGWLFKDDLVIFKEYYPRLQAGDLRYTST